MEHILIGIAIELFVIIILFFAIGNGLEEILKAIQRLQ